MSVVNQRGLVWALVRSAILSLAVASGTGFAAGAQQLDEFSTSIQNLTARVSPSVVKIQVTRYRTADESSNTDIVAGKQEAIGSGVIIDPEGYIITNAHVVQAAQKIQVSLQPPGEQSIANVVSQGFTKPQQANLVGIFKEGDLALIRYPVEICPHFHWQTTRSCARDKWYSRLEAPPGCRTR